LVFGQSTYTIKDFVTQESIPFVKVKPNVGAPFLADIDGIIHVDATATSVELHSATYRDTTILLENVVDQTIYLVPLVKDIMEVTVVAGENPAHRIINHAIENRKLNNPMENDAFRYNSYSKFIFDMNQDALSAIPDSTSDSTLIKMRKFFNEQYLFMLESASTRTFIPPSRDKEEITAYKVSGFNDPMFSTFANEMQSFSFYENQFELLGKTYINPIAFGGTKRYLFILEDTTIVKQDTTFTIFYRPRKGRNFEGMTGRLYINTNQWAIEKVTASPYEDTTGTEVIIVQEYALVDGKKWFPSKLSTEISFKSLRLSMKMPDAYIQGKGSTYIKQIELNPEGLRKRDFDNVSVTTAENAGDKKDSEWDSLRVYNITDKEERTYEMVDSLSKAEKFDKKLLFAKALAEGKLPLGNVNLDLTRLLDYDLYEKYRFGLGLETSKKVMKNATIGGYYAWATGDKESKFGGYSIIHLNRKNGVMLNLRYQQDLMERGGYSFQKDVFTFNTASIYKHFFIQNMERQRLGEVAVSGYMRSNMKITAIGNYQRIWYTDNYQYYSSGNPLTDAVYKDNDLAETSLEFTWNIREKVMVLGNQRVPKGTKWPKIMLKATKGWKGWFESDFNYLRLNAEIQQNISIRGLGVFNWTLAGGQTIGDVPLTLMQVGAGTGRNWNLSVANTFETMRPSEFYNSKQAALFTRMTFNAFKTKAKWNEPQIALHHAIGYGEMNAKQNHSVSFRSMDKGFFEGGLLLNNVLTSGMSGIGIGVFYRYGTYADPNWKQNLVFKISLSLNP
jgi:hypothetical protein